ncbi:hypothetical protein B0H11DRAFT_2421105 [Mycena galericulata]|nr:hypothetical protein B0H11DRAFT_2290650 [Mycena galericulata]KAJ7480320.1 hypothetical protein B0H11DRAFT_2421105 [Mycena galericulata]
MAKKAPVAKAAPKAARGAAKKIKTKTDTNFVAPATAKKNELPPRLPNPTRDKKNFDPAAPDLDRPRRTREESEAANLLEAQATKAADLLEAQATTRKALIALRLAELEAEKIAMLAEMELDDEAEEAKEAAASVSSLSDISDIPLEDIQRMPTSQFAALGGSLGDTPDEDDIPVDIFGLDIFDLDKDYETLVADKKKQDALELHAKVVAKGKKKKGDTRAAIDEAKEELKTKKRKSDEGEEHGQKLKPVFPSGFVNNWRDQVPTTVAAARTKTKTSVVAEPSLPLGGLTDFDAGSVAPTKLKGNRQVVEIVSDDEESDDDTPIGPAKAKLLPKKYDPEVAVKAELPRLDLKNVQRGRVGTPITTGTVTPATNVGNSGGNTGGGPTGIPNYAQARWVSDYLPTLAAKLGTLENMWDLPQGDVDFVQGVWDRVYPLSGYKVTLGCPVYLKAKDRINDRRSFFGKRGLAVVDAFFQQKEFVGNTKMIARYAKYALRDDGPCIWGTPAPAGVKRGEPGYTTPEDVFTSDHVVNVFAPFIKATAGTVYNYGYFRGGLAMTLTGLERAFIMYLTGTKVNDGSPFSREQVSTLVGDYYKSVDSLSNRRWKLIMDKCRAKNLEDVAVPLSASTMESNRHQLFTPSSP